MTPPPRKRFPHFDSFRALAALAIVVFHACGQTQLSKSPVFGGLARQLTIGVPVFFLISGFLLYRPFVAARWLGTDQPRVRRYARHRFLRIAPAYWVALTVVIFWYGFQSWIFDWPAVLYFYGFGQAYRQVYFFGGIVPAWTLTTEVAFYAFVPVYAFVLSRPWLASSRERILRSELTALGLLFAGSIAFRLALYAAGNTGANVLYTSLPGMLDLFAAGMFLAVASVALAQRRPWFVRLAEDAPLKCWGLAAAAYLVVAAAVSRSPSDPEMIARQVAFCLIAFLFLLPGVFPGQARGAVHRVLAWRPLLYTGLISYAIYLWHFPILKKLEDTGAFASSALGTLFLLAVGLAATLLIATLSWYAIERPALGLKDRALLRRPTREPPLSPTRGPAGRPG